MTIKKHLLTNRKGFTLTELLVVVMAIGILTGLTTGIFALGLKVWDGGSARSNIRTRLSQSLELTSNILGEATSINTITASSITFAADLGSGSTTYRVYLYSALDAEPVESPYSADTYSLRWADGTTYGTGQTIATDIAKPTHIPFSQSGNLINIDLTVTRGDESVRMTTKVRPTNL